MTRTVLRTTIRKKLGEATQVYWLDTDLDQWIEDAQLNIVWRTLCNKQRTVATTTADTVRYTLSSLVPNCLKILRCRIYDSSNEDWTQIEQKTQEYLDRNYPNWMTADTSEPQFYVYDIELDELILYPAADSDHVGAYLELYNVYKPTAVTSDGGEPDLPDTLHPAVVDYVVAMGLESRGYQDIANIHWQTYENKINRYYTDRGTEPDEEIIMRPC